MNIFFSTSIFPFYCIATIPKIVSLFLFGLVICFPIIAQTPQGFSPEKQITQFIINNWTTENGLPSNTLNYVKQTSDGYIWMSSYDGLARFDGVSITLFLKDQYPILATNSFTQIYEGRNKTMWLGSEGNGLVSYKNGVFKRYQLKTGITKRIDCIYETQNREILAGSRGGVYQLSGDSLRIYTEFPFENDNIKAIIEQNKTLWIASDGKGLGRKIGNKTEIFTVENGLPSNKVTNLYVDNIGVLWISTSAGAAFYDGSKFHIIKELTGEQVVQISQDADNGFWFATQKGLFRKNPLSNEFQFLNEKNGLHNQILRSIDFDKEGSLWIATYRGGLCRIKDQKFTNVTTLQGLASNTVNNIFEVSPTEHLISVDAQFAYILKNNKIDTIKHKTQMGNERIRFAIKDSKTNYWLATEKGLLRIDSQGKETFMTTETTGLPDNIIYRILEDTKGNIWLGSRNAGLIKILPDNKYEIYNKKNGIGSNFILAFSEAKNGDLLVSTSDAGFCILKTDKTIVNYAQEKMLKNSLVLNSSEDELGNIWLATNTGLMLLKNGKITVCNVLKKYSFYDILLDKSNNFWLPTVKGVLAVKRADVLANIADSTKVIPYRIFDKYDGMKQEQCTGGTPALMSSDGKVWLPTVGGVAMINPEKIADNKLIPNVLMEKVVVDNEIFPITTPLIFEAGKQRFVFHYTALSLLAPQRVRFKYKLEGVDKTWNDAGTERQAVYTNLSPRTYTFRVMACNNDGFWNEIGTKLTFTLKPYFYQTWWFYALCFISLVSIAILIYRQRVKQINKRNAILEETVLVRTAELQQQKEETESQRDSLAEQSLKLAQANNEIKASNEKMTGSIRYAQTIQQAILPSKEQLTLFFPENFIVFRPKDVVSGDFYWLSIIKNKETQIMEKIFLGVMDCTGHGVPGAFMSLIGNTLLNKIIANTPDILPAQLLEDLHTEIRIALHQDDKVNKDGMDVCLLRFEYNTAIPIPTVFFAGAKRPLYILSSHGELIEYKGSRKSIGGEQKKDSYFEDKNIKIEKNDTLILATDGYADQNNNQRESLGSVVFKEILVQMATESVENQQQQLIKVLQTYQKNESQRDDITIVGIKIT